MGQRDRRALAGRRVADVEAAVGDDEEEAVAGGEHVEVEVEVLRGGGNAVRAQDGELLSGAVVHGVDPPLMVVFGGEEREGGLAAVVGEEEFGVGCEAAAPGAAHGAAPADGLGRETRQDLPDDQLLGELRHAGGRFRRHGRPQRIWTNTIIFLE